PIANELLPILQRAEKAGAPLKLGRSIIPGQEAVHLSGLRPAGDVTIYLSYWEPLNTAALAYALRLDATKRGIVTAEEDTHADSVAVYLWRDNSARVGAGEHENAREAWLLAWLDAFEDKQEATP